MSDEVPHMIDPSPAVEMLVSSRSFEEYLAMFALSPADLDGGVLDCCAGASGFVAEMGRRALAAAAVDPAYGLDQARLADRVRGDLTGCVDMLLRDREHFVWTWYGSLKCRERLRHAAAAAFVEDRTQRPEVYVVGALPDLPFDDQAFRLALCSHLLFTWTPELDEDWHYRALVEMSRVATEVRVFPLVVRSTGRPVGFLDRLRRRLGEAGLATTIRQVPYEFQRGARQMLVLRRAP